MGRRWYVLLVFVFFLGALSSKETGNKIYVSPHQVEITDHGFIVRQDPLGKKAVAGKTLSFDQHGMYIKEWKGPCWIHDLWCSRCGGCGVILCPMNCSCFD